MRSLLVLALLLAGCAQAQSPEQALPGFTTNTALRSIELSELRGGGPPKDGIPSIDDPQFVSPEAASSWLADREPVILITVEGETRIYPLQILTWHEIVNDELAGVPVAITFCPLCYSAIAVDRRLDTDEGERTLTFGVSGLLRHSDMVMFDRETETLWQQFTGEALVGDLLGSTLTLLPAQIVSFAQARDAAPDAPVLSRDTGHQRDYGRNPYAGYDDVDKRPFLFDGKDNGQLPPMQRVIAVSVDEASRAYPADLTLERGVVADELADQPLVVFHISGTATALGDAEIASARDVGATGVFDPRVGDRTLTFERRGDRFVDAETASSWTITGEAVEGELAGTQLETVLHHDTFAFAWFAFKPDATVFEG
ncbi:MAG: DUF3179 domain-containing protein [Rubricoccaceae bacterium]